jgi:hypothetical protein
MSFEISSIKEEKEEHQQNVVPYCFEPKATDSREDESSEDEDEEHHHYFVPYWLEPEATDSDEDESSEDEVEDHHRLENTDWYDFPKLLFVTFTSKLGNHVLQVYYLLHLQLNLYGTFVMCIKTL